MTNSYIILKYSETNSILSIIEISDEYIYDPLLNNDNNLIGQLVPYSK